MKVQVGMAPPPPSAPDTPPSRGAEPGREPAGEPKIKARRFGDKCETHGTALTFRDIGRGKSVLECVECERARFAWLRDAISPIRNPFDL
jgi:hypothetical protein